MAVKKIGLKLSVECYLHNWLPPLDTFLLPHTAFHQAFPSLLPKGGSSEDGSGFSALSWSFHRLHGASLMVILQLPSSCVLLLWLSTARLCTASGFPTTLLTSSNFLSREKILSCQWYFTNASARFCALVSVRGQPGAHGGCWFSWWAAWNRAGVLHVVCHTASSACHYQCK